MLAAHRTTHLLAAEPMVINAKALIAPCNVYKPQSWERLHRMASRGEVHEDN
jgi:hypothetical protein